MLIIAKAFPPLSGGVERYSFQVAHAMKQLGKRPIIVTQTNLRGGLSRYEDLVVYNVGPGGQLSVFLKMLVVVYALCRKRKFQLYHATTWRVAIPPWLLKKRPLLITVHAREVFVPKWGLRSLMKAVLAYADAIVCVSQYTLSECWRRCIFARSKGSVSWNGINCQPLASLKSTSSASLRFFTICRLVQRKNVSGAIRALYELHLRNQLIPDWEYLIAGAGSESKALEELIRELQLDRHVKLIGAVSEQEKQTLYSTSHIFLHPQIALRDGDDVEGFGIVVAEAMYWGLPVIAGKAGGTADFVLHRETGVLVNGESIAEISEAIRMLVDDPNHRQMIADAGKHWVVQNLSWKRHTEHLLSACQIASSQSSR